MEMTENQSYTQPPSFLKQLSIVDWLYAIALAAGALFALNRFGAYTDYYEKGIMIAAVPVFSWLGWHWKPVRWLMLGLALLALSAIALYGGVLEMADKKFLLKYFLSSQSAILWMSMLFYLSTL